MANERTVVHALFTYRDEDGNERTALRGQTVELTDAELKRAEKLGAVAAADEDVALRTDETVRQPLAPTEVLAVGEQADDAGSREQQGETTETSGDNAGDGEEAEAATSRSSSRRTRSSS